MNNSQPASSLVLQGMQRLIERVTMENELWFPGLEGVIADETSISSIGDHILYRGYTLNDLAENSSFMEVAFLLLQGEIPNQEFLADFQSVVGESAELPHAVHEMLLNSPLHADPMDTLRTGISLLGEHNSHPTDFDRHVVTQQAIQLLAQLPVMMAARHRQQLGFDPVTPDMNLSYVANLIWMLTGKLPSALQERALDALFILYAEHGFNPSTYTARLVASTGADYFSCMTSALGAMKGPLHGGLRDRVIDLLNEVDEKNKADSWVQAALKMKRALPGFGHRVHAKGDPRARMLRKQCRELASAGGNEELEERADAIRHAVAEHYGMLANLNWPAARLLHYLDISPELFSSLFVISRLAGWSAHVIEQYESRSLIRPRSRYNGPGERRFVPIDRRS